MFSKKWCWQFRICHFRLMSVTTFDSLIKKERSMLVFFPSLVKSIIRSPGGRLFLELVFILLVRLQSVTIALKPVALH